MKQSNLNKEKYTFPIFSVIESDIEESIAYSTGQTLNDYDNDSLLDDDEDFN